jgi:ArsR family transcriptional regulator
MKKKVDIILAPVFRAMADSTRLKILLMLEAKPRTVGEIVSFFNLSQPTITRHLQALTAAGLVKRSRKGQHVRYELNAENLRTVCVDLADSFPCCSIAVISRGGMAISDVPLKSKKNKKGVGSCDTIAPVKIIKLGTRKKGGRR